MSYEHYTFMCDTKVKSIKVKVQDVQDKIGITQERTTNIYERAFLLARPVLSNIPLQICHETKYFRSLLQSFREINVISNGKCTKTFHERKISKRHRR